MTLTTKDWLDAKALRSAALAYPGKLLNQEVLTLLFTLRERVGSKELFHIIDTLRNDAEQIKIAPKQKRTGLEIDSPPRPTVDL